MTPELTGAERYLASRMNNRDYREAYSEAKFLIGIATAVHPDAYEIERRACD